jgi:hypothetical protein
LSALQTNDKNKNSDRLLCKFPLFVFHFETAINSTKELRQNRVSKRTEALKFQRCTQMTKTTENAFYPEKTDEDWFNLGKSDAWEGKPKTPPEEDARAASMYELGYSEGEIKRPPTESGTKN